MITLRVCLKILFGFFEKNENNYRKPHRLLEEWNVGIVDGPSILQNSILPTFTDLKEKCKPLILNQLKFKHTLRTQRTLAQSAKNLVGRAIFRSFLEVEHEVAQAEQVVLAGCPGVVAQGHMVVYAFQSFIESAYAGGAPGGLFLVVVIMISLIVKQKT